MATAKETFTPRNPDNYPSLQGLSGKNMETGRKKLEEGLKTENLKKMTFETPESRRDITNKARAILRRYVYDEHNREALNSLNDAIEELRKVEVTGDQDSKEAAANSLRDALVPIVENYTETEGNVDYLISPTLRVPLDPSIPQGRNALRTEAKNFLNQNSKLAASEDEAVKGAYKDLKDLLALSFFTEVQADHKKPYNITPPETEDGEEKKEKYPGLSQLMAVGFVADAKEENLIPNAIQVAENLKATLETESLGWLNPDDNPEEATARREAQKAGIPFKNEREALRDGTVVKEEDGSSVAAKGLEFTQGDEGPFNYATKPETPSKEEDETEPEGENAEDEGEEGTPGAEVEEKTPLGPPPPPEEETPAEEGDAGAEETPPAETPEEGTEGETAEAPAEGETVPEVTKKPLDISKGSDRNKLRTALDTFIKKAELDDETKESFKILQKLSVDSETGELYRLSKYVTEGTPEKAAIDAIDAAMKIPHLGDPEVKKVKEENAQKIAKAMVAVMENAGWENPYEVKEPEESSDDEE